MGAMGAMGVMPRLLLLLPPPIEEPPIEEVIGAPPWIPGGAGLGSSRCSWWICCSVSVASSMESCAAVIGGQSSACQQ